ncbi:hypothetical protein MESS4_650011 [Mesorhizobium sp. STM 4661]|nr:hypothetical protein MESS4_650011 [Mesorhizobium sp. STM 4661]
MVVDDLHVFGTGSGPSETDTPLVVDAYRMLPGAASFQSFEVVSGRRSKVVQLGGIVDRPKTAFSASNQIRRKPFRRPTRRNRFHRPAFERNDQSCTPHFVSYTDTK